MVGRIEVALGLRDGNRVSLFDTTVAVRESICLVTEPEGRLKLRTQECVAQLQRSLQAPGTLGYAEMVAIVSKQREAGGQS